MIRCAGYLILAVLFSPESISAQDQGTTVEAGQRVFAQRCASCHGDTGEGRESTERTFSVELRPLGSEEVQERTDEEFRALLLDGGLRAKPIRNLNAADAGSVILFLRTLRLED